MLGMINPTNPRGTDGKLLKLLLTQYSHLNLFEQGISYTVQDSAFPGFRKDILLSLAILKRKRKKKGHEHEDRHEVVTRRQLSETAMSIIFHIAGQLHDSGKNGLIFEDQSQTKPRIVKVQTLLDSEDEKRALLEGQVSCLLDYLHAKDMVFIKKSKQMNCLFSYLVMRYLPWRDLFDVLHKDRSNDPALTVPERFAISIAVLDGVEYFHQRGYIHRDVSPDNFMIERIGPTLRALLIDCGLVKPISEMESGVLLGKPNYAPLEAYERKPLDRSSDLFSAMVCIVNIWRGNFITSLNNETDKISLQDVLDYNVESINLFHGIDEQQLPNEIRQQLREIIRLGIQHHQSRRPTFQYCKEQLLRLQNKYLSPELVPPPAAASVHAPNSGPHRLDLRSGLLAILQKEDVASSQTCSPSPSLELLPPTNTSVSGDERAISAEDSDVPGAWYYHPRL